MARNVPTTPFDAGAAVQPAGFWKRTFAWCIDALMVLPGALCVLVVFAKPGALMAQFQTLQALVDTAVLSAVTEGADFASVLSTLLVDPAIRGAAQALATQVLHVSLVFAAAFAFLSGLLQVWGDTHAAQGSPGKRMMGLRVVHAVTGQRLTPLQALGRHLAGSASWFSLNLGHLMAALPPDHRALHDRLSNTRLIA